MVQTYANQLFHNTSEPLDSTSQVESFEDLSDTTKVIPYNGKLVHVKADNTFYTCVKPEGAAASWRPVMKADGTAMFLTTADGQRTFKIMVKMDGAGVGRIDVEY